MMGEKEAYWRKQVTQWQKSGLSQSEYARRHELKKSTFDYWVGKYRNESLSTGEFLAVRRPPTVLEIVGGAVVIRVPEGSDLSGLKRGIEVLQDA